MGASTSVAAQQLKSLTKVPTDIAKAAEDVKAGEMKAKGVGPTGAAPRSQEETPRLAKQDGPNQFFN